jgi:hypothetical protein
MRTAPRSAGAMGHTHPMSELRPREKPLWLRDVPSDLTRLAPFPCGLQRREPEIVTCGHHAATNRGRSTLSTAPATSQAFWSRRLGALAESWTLIWRGISGEGAQCPSSAFTESDVQSGTHCSNRSEWTAPLKGNTEKCLGVHDQQKTAQDWYRRAVASIAARFGWRH